MPFGQNEPVMDGKERRREGGRVRDGRREGRKVRPMDSGWLMMGKRKLRNLDR